MVNRVRINATINVHLLKEVDAYVSDSGYRDRSHLIEEGIRKAMGR